MEIDVLRIAELSNLSISEEEFSRLSRQMSDIVDMISTLPEGTCESAPQKAVMSLRTDEVCDSLAVDNVLSNAPKAFDGCFAVPRTVD